MNYHFKIHSEDGGFWAECVELEGCVTQADSREELLLNAAEALNLYLSEPDDSSILFPAPRKRVSGKNVVAVPVEPKTAFAQALRQARVRRGMAQQQGAALLGMKNPYSYQRLESARNANPALLTIARIKTVLGERQRAAK